MSFAFLHQGLLGGTLVGLSATSLLLLNGDTLGASGIVHQVACKPLAMNQPWRTAFLASVFLTSTVMFQPTHMPSSSSDPIHHTYVTYAIAGFLVGFGSKLANGCTSGHGICGLGRRSPRSLAAVLVMMLAGILTSTLTTTTTTTIPFETMKRDGSFDAAGMYLAALASVLAAVAAARTNNKNDDNNKKLFGAVLSGGLFASGLFVGGMADPKRVLGFLDLSGFADNRWDGTLLGVLGAGLLVSWAGYQFVTGAHQVFNAPTLRHPIALSKSSLFRVPGNKVIDARLLLGSACFGIGWGMAGLCPGPALCLAAVGSIPVLVYWWPAFFAGTYLAGMM
jgi:uncharacterized membrane protein YedE/YeeE